jgi:hypothetical protein
VAILPNERDSIVSKNRQNDRAAFVDDDLAVVLDIVVADRIDGNIEYFAFVDGLGVKSFWNLFLEDSQNSKLM